eukprot:scaffold133392_cov44-Attheya_sp.AAC.1
MEMMETPGLEPSFRVLNQHHIAQYRAYLPVGTFVVLQDEFGVWRIVKFSDSNIVVNQFVPVHSAAISIHRSICNALIEGEVRGGGERGFCQGMTNAFILRYTIVVEDNEEVKKRVLDRHCLLFPSDYIEYRQLLSSCFPSIVWRHMSVIQ